MKILVYVRNDLNMRKGKISAQVSHAVMGIWLNAMEKTASKFILKGNNLNLYELWRRQGSCIEIIPVEDEEILIKAKNENKTNSVLITDQGRTEFKGVPTNTCLGVFTDKSIKMALNTDCLAEKDTLLPSKQVIVANKDLKINKWDLSSIVAESSLDALFSKGFRVDDTFEINIDSEGLKSWLLGSFAKIVLKADSKELLNLNDLLKNSEIARGIKKTKEGKISCISVGADTIEKVDYLTKNYKLF